MYFIRVLLFVFMSTAAATSIASGWHKIDGVKITNKGVSIKCEEGTGWRRCGEEEVEEIEADLTLLVLHYESNPNANGLIRGSIFGDNADFEVKMSTSLPDTHVTKLSRYGTHYTFRHPDFNLLFDGAYFKDVTAGTQNLGIYKDARMKISAIISRTCPSLFPCYTAFKIDAYK